MLRVLTQLVGPSLSAVIDGVSYIAGLKVNNLYTARLRCRTCSRTRAGTQNAIRCPDFGVVIRRDHAVWTRRVGTALNADECADCKLGYRIIACFDLIDRLVGAVGKKVEPDLGIDKADVERVEFERVGAVRHADYRGLCKSLIRRERRRSEERRVGKECRL